MNTDMNQYLIFRYASTVVRKMTAYQLCCAGLARSPFVLTEHISSLVVPGFKKIHGFIHFERTWSKNSHCIRYKYSRKDSLVKPFGRLS